VAAVLALFVFACGGDDAGGGATSVATPGDLATGATDGAGDDGATVPPLNVCSIVPAADVGEAVGAEVVAADSTLPGTYGCDYFAGEGAEDYVSISVRTGAQEELRAGFNARAAGHEAVEELGEQAYWNEERGELGALSGAYDVFIVIYDPDLSGDELRDAAVRLAGQALAAVSAP
jgi:hypothetical protein